MHGEKKKGVALALFTSTILATAAPAHGASIAMASPSLEADFQNPPNSARPRVWWHWLNGDVTKDGIRKDLEWMKRSGIGGLQNFQGNFAIPPIVDHPLAYMTPDWKDAVHDSAELADQLGLEIAVASAPGWSETGGPWVKPQDAVKKLVWSETTVEGGRRFESRLPQPPSIAGPFQDLAPAPELSPTPRMKLPDYYADAAVFAYRSTGPDEAPAPKVTLADGKALDAGVLTDGRFGDGVAVPRGSSTTPTIVNLSYERPQTIRSATLFIPGSATIYAPPTVTPTLEASVDGAWRKVAVIGLSIAPTTVSFAPVTARQFRVVLASQAAGPALTLSELRLSPQARVNDFELKAGFALAPDYYALDAGVGGEAAGVAPGDVVDLTGRMTPDGALDWTPPKGRWRIVRMGYSLTGALNHPAPTEATGLEVDKLDAAAVRKYLAAYFQGYRSALGPGLIGGHGLRAFVSDSSEVGPFNWTPRLLEQFQRLRGYDPRPWLPALTGVIVGSRAESDRFLYDFRRTIGDLHASEHYGTIAAFAHENGLKYYAESLEGGRTSLGDDMDMRRDADVPMSALWTYPPQAGPKGGYIADMRGAASVSHLYGQNLVAAESMTSTHQPWAHAPSDLRRVIDLEFASGVNLPAIHTSVHQPLDKPPGLSMRHIGQFFTRNETWAEMARPWVDYMARNSFLLQQGRFVADVAYFYGEEAPVGEQARDGYFTDVPSRYGYDFVSPSALTDLLKVQGGDLVAPSGARYRVLYLSGASARMTLPVLRKIAAFAEAGATIVGDAPTGSPSLKDDPAEFAALVHRLWSGQPVTNVGQGRVIAGRDVEAALGAIGVAPDFAVAKPAADSDLMFVHRRLADGDIYYVDNRVARREQLDVRFRVTGKAPEIWRADTGAMTPASYRIEGGETVVPLKIDAEDSFFVIFRKPATAPSRIVPDAAPVVVGTLDDDWTVAFQPDRGAPPSATLAALAPLNESKDPGIKYFSGVATYTKTFKAPAGYRPGTPLWLDLGRVGDLAEVRVNGRMLGTVWHAPYRIDVGPALRRGENQLDVRVADLWVNRLIGDRQPGATKTTWTVMPAYPADAPLRPSGLIGPVTLLAR